MRFKMEADYLKDKKDLETADLNYVISKLGEEENKTKDFYDRMLKISGLTEAERATLRKEADQKITQLDIQMGQKTAEISEKGLEYSKAIFIYTDKQRDRILDLQKQYSELNGTLKDEYEIQKKISEFQLSKLDSLSEEYRVTKQLLEAELQRKAAIATMNVPQLVNIGTMDAAKKANLDVANQWSNLLPNSIDVLTNSVRNAQGSFKNFFTSLGEGFLKLAEDIMYTIAKMEILNALGYGQKGSSTLGGMGGGIISGLIGSVLGEGGIMNASFSPIRSFQGGGYADRPTLGVFGEGGPEAFVPLRNGKIPIEGGRGKTIITNNITQITAMDTQSMRDFFKRSKGYIISAVQDDANGHGVMNR